MCKTKHRKKIVTWKVAALLFDVIFDPVLNSIFSFFLGNVLLPSMGLCDLNVDILDASSRFAKKYRFICEISPNIRYQYLLVIMWFLFIASITVSIFGLILTLLRHSYYFLCLARTTAKETIYRFISLRETEYLVFIKENNLILYGEILRKLKQTGQDLEGRIADGFEMSNSLL